MAYCTWKDLVWREPNAKEPAWEREAARLNREWLNRNTTTIDPNNGVRVIVGDKEYMPSSVDIEITADGDYPRVDVSAYMNPRNCLATKSTRYANPKPATNPTITNVIFNPPATIVFWSDKTKTIVKHDPNLEAYDPEKGLAMAICKKLIGNNESKYYNTFKHWLKKCDYYTKEDPKNV